MRADARPVPAPGATYGPGVGGSTRGALADPGDDAGPGGGRGGEVAGVVAVDGGRVRLPHAEHLAAGLVEHDLPPATPARLGPADDRARAAEHVPTGAEQLDAGDVRDRPERGRPERR